MDKDPRETYPDSPEQVEIDEFAVDFGYTMRHRTPDEFIAVLSQNYILGKERFLSLYGLFLNATLAQSLYAFAEANIYRKDS